MGWGCSPPAAPPAENPVLLQGTSLEVVLVTGSGDALSRLRLVWGPPREDLTLRSSLSFLMFKIREGLYKPASPESRTAMSPSRACPGQHRVSVGNVTVTEDRCGFPGAPSVAGPQAAALLCRGEPCQPSGQPVVRWVTDTVFCGSFLA